MDKLTRFNQPISGVVSITSEGGNSVDDVISKLERLINEARLNRAGHETWDWNKLVEDDDDIELSDLGLYLVNEEEDE